MSEKTVGEHSLELMQKKPDTRDPIALQREIQKNFIDELSTCAESGKKEIDGDFFLVVLTKKERLMPNVLRNYFGFRRSCPTPEWDQTVFRYHKEGDHIEFLWVVPSKDTCELFKNNVLQIDDNEKDLLRFILDFDDGTLLELAKKLNKEVPQ